MSRPVVRGRHDNTENTDTRIISKIPITYYYIVATPVPRRSVRSSFITVLLVPIYIIHRDTNSNAIYV